MQEPCHPSYGWQGVQLLQPPAVRMVPCLLIHTICKSRRLSFPRNQPLGGSPGVDLVSLVVDCFST